MDNMGLWAFLGFIATHLHNRGSAIGLLPRAREHPFGRNSQHGRL